MIWDDMGELLENVGDWLSDHLPESVVDTIKGTAGCLVLVIVLPLMLVVAFFGLGLILMFFDDGIPEQDWGEHGTAEVFAETNVDAALERLETATESEDYVTIITVTGGLIQQGFGESEPRLHFLNGLAHYRRGDQNAAFLSLQRHISLEGEYSDMAQQICDRMESEFSTSGQ